jgi:hypothetical protein
MGIEELDQDDIGDLKIIDAITMRVISCVEGRLDSQAYIEPCEAEYAEMRGTMEAVQVIMAQV